MMPVPGHPPTPAELVCLTYELLDAHADTIEISRELSDGLPWEAHLDYLRALQRKAREILARWPAAPEPIGRP
jgi:hypothetical protein